jgi:subtilisin family serine protease
LRLRILSALALVVLGMTVSGAQQTQPDSEVIVNLRNGQPIVKVARDASAHVVRQVPGQSIYLLQVDSGTRDDAIKKLLQSPLVAAAEPNRPLRLESALNPATPSDARLGQAMAALLDGQTITNFYGTDVLQAYITQPALQIIGAPDVRNISTGVGTRIGYIDTGVDPDHPVLQPWLDPGIDLVGSGSVSEFDGVTLDVSTWVRANTGYLIDRQLSFLLKQSMAALLDDGSGQPSPAGFPGDFGHGTLVAGVLHVVAPQARIVPIRAFDAYGNTTLFKLIEGIYRGADAGVDVLNMSFSLVTTSPTFQRAISYAQSSGVALVASAGNEAQNAGGIYPAASGAVCGVAATDFNDRLAPFSNYGSVISVSAPGSYVISTAPAGRYAMAWGTSFSAPIISAAIALVASVSPRAPGTQNSAFVTSTAVPIDDKNPDYFHQLGRGRVYLPNVFRSLHNVN